MNYKNNYKFCRHLFESVTADKTVAFSVRKTGWQLRLVENENTINFDFLRDNNAEWATVVSVSYDHSILTTKLIIHTDYRGILNDCNEVINFMMRNVRYSCSKWLVD